MSIIFDISTKSFKLDTPNSTYVIQISQYGYVSHLYYGAKISDSDVSHLFPCQERSFSPNPAGAPNRDFSLDTLPQEYATHGMGDYRVSAIIIKTESGHTATDLHYHSHTIIKGKPKLKGLPATYVNDEEEADTLQLVLFDQVSGAEVTLLYSVFTQQDVITRSVEVKNKSDKPFFIERIMSLCVDFYEHRLDFIHLWGGWSNERMLSRSALHHGKQGFESNRGTSSHQHNPFFALVKPNTDENIGEAYGFNLVYSGNHLAEVEVNQAEETRAVMGINPTDFSWILKSSETFAAPEAVLVYSNEGLGGMSRIFHRFYLNNLCRGEWKYKRCPIIINNWEATYYDFDDEKLLKIAIEASKLGIEMLVMDDGWFGKRCSDKTSLGDWFVNEDKLKGGLPHLVSRVNKLGIDFGIWIEPEMISEDSELYRNHPEYCLQISSRSLSTGRDQLVLDMTREDVRDYLFASISEILKSANIRYVKWDMNRHLTQVGSLQLPANQQNEVFHRYVLGVYDLMERLTRDFPDILFENCSGGGGRFDPAMLYYSPQIWTSDNTDAIKRLEIQYGTSLCYPASTMGAHVSAVPNHQTGRYTNLDTRGVIAMWGTFGYELDITNLTDLEKETIKKQIETFKKHAYLIAHGDFYRIISPFENGQCAWGFVSADKTEILISYVQIKGQANGKNIRLTCKGADPKKKYKDEISGKTYFGDTLMHAGIAVPELLGDGISYVCYLKSILL